MVHDSHPYMTTLNTRALISLTFVPIETCLSRQTAVSFEIAARLRARRRLISWEQSLSLLIKDPRNTNSSTSSSPSSSTLNPRIFSVLITLVFKRDFQVLVVFCYESGVTCTSQIVYFSSSNSDAFFPFFQLSLSHYSSLYRLKRYGDKVHRCRTPLSTVKTVRVLPFCADSCSLLMIKVSQQNH